MKVLENIKVQLALLMIAEVICLVAMFYADIEGINIIPFIVMFVLHLTMMCWLAIKMTIVKKDDQMDLVRVLGVDAKDAMMIGEMGLITFDDQYYITWMSDFLMQRKSNLNGKKLSSWFSDISKLIGGQVSMITVKDKDYVYEISRKEQSNVLFVKDITKYYNIAQKMKDSGNVVGIIQLDNYLEIQQYEEETKMSEISVELRTPIISWAQRHGLLIRRIRSDRYLLIGDEKILSELISDKFSILNIIRKKAEAMDVYITLSMAFAYGSNDYIVLDKMVNDLLEIATSRGGDQVVVKHAENKAEFFGGNSEAKEKRSKVRVRVMSQTIFEAIENSDKVFVVGHKTMDFDCMGAALCVSSIAQHYGKDTYIVSKSGGIETQLSEALSEQEKTMGARHHFISDEEAKEMIQNKDLVLVVDHNSLGQCGASETLKSAKRIVVVDHHRRGEDTSIAPLLNYIETSASSTCELLSEFLPYLDEFKLPIEEATIMYVGILVDTNHFRARTGSRTFEAVAYLRKIGVDPIVAENMLREKFLDFQAKSKIVNSALPIMDKMVVVPYDDKEIITRTLMSQAADTLLDIKGMEASFVIARINENSVAISARSKAEINVQAILEKMGGGGHFNAAGYQKDDTSVVDVYEELKRCIKLYMDENKEEVEYESNLNK